MKGTWTIVFVAALLFATPLRADVWDAATDSDDSISTDNTPIHGTVQVHDLGARPGPLPDQDWFSFDAIARTSYEAVIEGLTGDTGGSLGFSMLASDGTTVVATGSTLNSPGCSMCTQSVRFNNNTASSAGTFIRVDSPACRTTCKSSDQYTFRFYETTYAIARFNNSGSQTTVLLIQNTRNYSINADAHFWNAAGGFLGTHSATIPARGLLVVSTSALGFAAGASGSITVSHDGRYGDLNGKAVALEPATGFSFDSPMVPRPL